MGHGHHPRAMESAGLGTDFSVIALALHLHLTGFAVCQRLCLLPRPVQSQCHEKEAHLPPPALPLSTSPSLPAASLQTACEQAPLQAHVEVRSNVSHTRSIATRNPASIIIGLFTLPVHI
jgi:hypothetical protein